MGQEAFVVYVKEGHAARADMARAVSELAPFVQAAELSWVNVEVDDLASEGQAATTALGFPEGMVEGLLRTEHSSYDDRDTELGVMVPMIRVEALQVEVEPLLLLINAKCVVTLYERGRATRFRKFARYAETALKKIPADAASSAKVTILITRILNENNERNFDGIRPIEDEGDKLSSQLVNEAIDRRKVARNIYSMKRALIGYLDALWSSLDVIHYLRHGDAELITDDETLLQRVSLLGDDVRRHIELSEHLSEVLASGLEVMQSIYNNQLQAINNRMAFVVTWLTVLGTAVLVPNTIGTVLAAAPPELRITDPRLFLAVILGSTVVSTVGAWVWIRARIPLPKKLD